MALWGGAMTGTNRRRTITRWLMAGLPYRTWTVKEMTFVLYEELVTDLYEAGPEQVKNLREFLRIAGDVDRLAALDREIMGQRGGVTPEPTPALRGRAHG